MLKISNFVRKYWFIFLAIGLYFLLAALNVLPRGINIFKKHKLIIDETPVVVKEIREIGELTTCEFYGEVYADLNEVYEDLIKNHRDSVAMNPDAFYLDYSGLEEYISKSGDYIKKEQEYDAVSERYEAVMAEYHQKQETFMTEEKKLKEEISKIAESKKEKRQLESRIKDLKEKFESEKKSFEKFQSQYRKVSNEYTEERIDFWESRKKRNLVYIGRGWVKAGINLKDLTEDDLIIDDDDSVSIQVLISDPVVLDVDINPWFIYTDEKKVKGYEVFMAKTGSILSDKNFTDKEVTQLKIKCKEKLKEAALEKGLLKSASTSATQTLENFFRLIGFKKVTIRYRSNTELVVKKDN